MPVYLTTRNAKVFELNEIIQMETQIHRIVTEMANMWVNLKATFSFFNVFFKKKLICKAKIMTLYCAEFITYRSKIYDNNRTQCEDKKNMLFKFLTFLMELYNIKN